MTSLKSESPPTNAWLRLTSCMMFQRDSLICPTEPALHGKVAVVTGGTGGIGEATTRGLLARGATLILPCRNLEKGRMFIDSLTEGRERVHLVSLELDDLATVAGCVSTMAELLAERRVDILVENAGVWPQVYETTAQGHETAFGTNVLGHFALRHGLQTAGLLSDVARVVVVTGDIYALQRECTADYRWRGLIGGLRAYGRSKLGNIWIARELQQRHPELTVVTVHPGVVASNLAGSSTGVVGWSKSRMMIDTGLGAETSLYCATQPDVEKGGYYHNVYGLVRLAESDPALNAEAARSLWQTCEQLVS